MVRAQLASNTPGARPLQNVIEQVVLTGSNVARLDPGQLRNEGSKQEGQLTLAATERERILAALHASGWVLSGTNGAAARLAMSRTTLQSKMKKLGIPKRPRQTKATMSAPLGSKSVSNNVLRSNSKRMVTDGPFTETHELLGG